MHTVVTIIEVIRLGDHLSICYAVLSLERMSMALVPHKGQVRIRAIDYRIYATTIWVKDFYCIIINIIGIISCLDVSIYDCVITIFQCNLI